MSRGATAWIVVLAAFVVAALFTLLNSFPTNTDQTRSPSSRSTTSSATPSPNGTLVPRTPPTEAVEVGYTALTVFSSRALDKTRFIARLAPMVAPEVLDSLRSLDRRFPPNIRPTDDKPLVLAQDDDLVRLEYRLSDRSTARVTLAYEKTHWVVLHLDRGDLGTGE